MSSITIDTHEWAHVLMRAARPFACSVAIHLGLGALVVAGSAALTPPLASHVAWLDLEVAEAPAASPPPIVASPRPRPTPRPPVEAKAPEPRKVAPPVVEEPVAPPAPPVAAPPREVTPPEPSPAQSPPSPAQSSVVMGPTNASAPERNEASSSLAPSAASSDSRPARATPERGGVNGGDGPVVASRPPDASPGGPVVRAARPRGGYQVRPVYPEAARRAGIQGTTLLRIVIERDGHVSDVNVERSAGHKALDEAAAEAVRRWRFEPARSAAGPVSVSALIPVEFRIGDRE